MFHAILCLIAWPVSWALLEVGESSLPAAGSACFGLCLCLCISQDFLSLGAPVWLSCTSVPPAVQGSDIIRGYCV